VAPDAVSRVVAAGRETAAPVVGALSAERLPGLRAALYRLELESSLILPVAAVAVVVATVVATFAHAATAEAKE
jgi:hypothetical protein